MPMSTADCKQFLDGLAAEHGIPANTVWKRTRRYAADFGGQKAVLRDFESASGATAVIAEVDGALHVVSIAAAGQGARMGDMGERTFPIDHVITDDDVFRFVADCFKADPQILAKEFGISEDDDPEWAAEEAADMAKIQRDAEKASSWTRGETEELPHGTVDPDDLDFGIGVIEAFYGQQHDFTQLRRIVEVFMPDHDTRYRYFVPIFADNRLVLPVCNGD